MKIAEGIRAALTSGGYQEQMVLVKGGYTPDVIVVEHGKPVRLNFIQQESAACSEMVLLPAFFFFGLWALIMRGMHGQQAGMMAIGNSMTAD